ncbi:branched-chain amino acid ABC transporter permease [Desulfuromonas versatilis]|uniref:Branched-chain amino acid ABC transporter permease n=1 Tax=Desulfuromonas versatilis TaxID=2802975 RepID=A0ABM8HS51_9BACT|nr:AzlC family ABC transporter permease [Desulfuromonas versatilis]BCR03775.1 branched-chain amino acid ABC transporter permease [Desulfuromonas versatilis]
MNAHPEKTNHSKGQKLREGLCAAWPICLGYFPIGLALGVLGQKAGLGPLQIGLMSVLVFAGSAQFIAVAMIAAGSSFGAIVTTTFVVNFRHFLMSSAMAVYLARVHRGFLSLFAYGITDESFAVNMTRFRQGDWDRWRALVVNHAANLTWVFATVTGALVGAFIPPGAFGIDYALVAMFLCLLVFQLQGRIYILTALIAGVFSVTWYLWVPGDSYVVVASVAAATVGYLLRRRRRGSKA